MSIYTLLFLLSYDKEEIYYEIKDYSRVSIIVPSYNEGKNIKNTLERLIDLEYPKDKLEIIVVDDGSKDNTYEIAKEYEEKYNFIKVYKKENGGKSSALNYGIKRSSGEIIVTLDADSIPEKDSLIKMLKYMYYYNADIVVPAIQTINTKKLIEKYQYIDYSIHNFSRMVIDKMNSIFIASGPFSVFKRSVFEKIGLFDEKNISEDMEIALRAQKTNFKIKFCPEVIIKTVPPDNFKSLLKQRVRWVLGFIDNYMKYRDIENIYLREIVFGISIILYVLLPLSFLIILYMYGKQLYDFLRYLSSINYDIYYFIKYSFSFDINTYIFQLLSTSQLILITFSFILLINFVLFISIYKRYDKSKSWLSIIYYSVIYLFFSIYFNAIFIIVAIYYKLFGRNLRWGGIVWKNSLINKLLNKKYG